MISCVECNVTFRPTVSTQIICGRKCAGKHANRKRVQKYESTVETRFWSRVNKKKCWTWTGAVSAEGYGTLRINSKTWLAHRFAWTLTYGSVANDTCVLHRCDNPPCVNPDHLFSGDRSINNKDKVLKGRQSRHDGIKNPNAKLTTEQIKEIRALYATGQYKQVELAARFGVIQPHISRIIRKEAWSWKAEL